MAESCEKFTPDQLAELDILLNALSSTVETVEIKEVRDEICRHIVRLGDLEPYHHPEKGEVVEDEGVIYGLRKAAILVLKEVKKRNAA